MMEGSGPLTNGSGWPKKTLKSYGSGTLLSPHLFCLSELIQPNVGEEDRLRGVLAVLGHHALHQARQALQARVVRRVSLCIRNK